MLDNLPPKLASEITENLEFTIMILKPVSSDVAYASILFEACAVKLMGRFSSVNKTVHLKMTMAKRKQL